MFQRGRLIRESEWMRVYEGSFKSHECMHYESKFLTDGIRVSADAIITRWPGMSLEEKNEFANAFGVKTEVTPEDERVLNFLMETGEPQTWMAIAPLLPLHRNRERVLRFLLEKIRESQQDNANFFHALTLMREKRSVPALRASYDSYRKRYSTEPGAAPQPDYIDYLYCCEALWRIDGSPGYRQAIEEASKSQDQSVRATAEMLLREP